MQHHRLHRRGLGAGWIRGQFGHGALAERAIRPLTLGRRNWTFLGSDAGGERAAVFFTLIQSCKLNEVNPEAYLADLVGRLESGQLGLAESIAAYESGVAIARSLQAELADPALSRRRISGRFAASEPQDVLATIADMQGLTLRREASGRLLIER